MERLDGAHCLVFFCPDKPDLLHGLLSGTLTAAGDEVYQQIEVDMFRMAALYVLERQKPGLIAHLLLCLLQRTQLRPAKADRRPPMTKRQATLNRASVLCAPLLPAGQHRHPCVSWQEPELSS